MGIGNVLKVMVQALLFFGSETWETTPCMGRSMGGFHNMLARQITGRQSLLDGSWEYPKL